MAKSFTPLFSFTVPQSREVDETITRVEGEGATALTVTETKKVTKVINVPFCFKVPSRLEDEEGDIVQASWWSRFIERGIMAEAMLIKLYTNQGGTMPEQYRASLDGLNSQLFDTELKLQEAEVLHKGDMAVLGPLRLQYFDLREKITAIHRSQAPYFENTAEAKSREKHIEWLVLHMSHWKPVAADESLGEWQPFFAGKTTDDKLVSYDRLREEDNVLLAAARERLELVATFYSSSKGQVTGQQIGAFLETDEELAANA